MTALAQSRATGSATSATSCTAIFGSSVTSGNTIIVAITINTRINSVSSITDTLGNTYTEIDGGTLATASPDVLMTFYGASVGSSGTNTITLNTTSSCNMTVVASEYTQLSLTRDTKNEGFGSTTSVTGTASTTTNANDLIIAAVSNTGNNTYTAGAGYGNLSSVSASTVLLTAVEDQVVSATGSYNPTFTQSSTAAWACYWMAIKSSQVSPTLTGLSSITGLSNITF